MRAFASGGLQRMRGRLAAFAAALLLALAARAADDAHQPRNIVLMIGDGMGYAQVGAYRLFADDPDTVAVEPLVVDPWHVGSVATQALARECTDATGSDCRLHPYLTTDSAAAATAFATGVDTLNGAIGVDADGEPLTTLLERARALGKSTGLVATSQITHATPAAFAAHVPSRRQYAAIADQYLDNRVADRPVVDVLLGGGLADFARRDRDLLTGFRDLGYAYAASRRELLDLESMPALGLFAPRGLPRAWDRPPEVPSLAEMTGKALELLNDDEDGFVLMVEGSQIDWAGHGNDILGVMSEMEDFLAAVARVLAFASAGGDTLVVITSDHETGGLSVGRDGEYRWRPEALRGAGRTPAAMAERFAAGEESLSEVIARHAPFELSVAERTVLDTVQRDADAAYGAISALFSARSRSGWTTDGHTAEDVPLYATGPGAGGFRGLMPNEAVGQALIAALGTPAGARVSGAATDPR